jgi:hypothetical protein
MSPGKERKRRNRTVAIGLLWIGLLGGPLAAAGSEGSNEYVLPDVGYVQRECTLLHQQSAKYYPGVSHKVERACRQFDAGKLNGDAWLAQIDPLARAIDREIPCLACLRQPLEPRAPIPESFASYSTFLVPDTFVGNKLDWDQILALRRAFEAFGDSIGDRRAAIWFDPERHGFIRTAKSETRNSEPLISVNPLVDTMRSKEYCDKFGLNYNDGPYVVTTRKRPDRISVKDERVVIKLGGISPDGLVRVLNVLERDLRSQREIHKRALLYEEVKQRILTLAGRYPELAKGLITTVLSGK